MHPYHYCLIAMLERYCDFLRLHNAKGDVLAESRGGNEDNMLKKEYKNIYDMGTMFRKPIFFSSVLSTHEIKLKSKTNNIAGLQIADLLAYPSKIDILFENKILENNTGNFGKSICKCISMKYYRHFCHKSINGYGKIFLQ